MLFKPEHIDMILKGKKTATRRVWKKPMVKIGGIYKCKLEMLSEECFAKIKVIKLFKQLLGDITEEDAKKEGYLNKREFMDIWEEVNKCKWNSRQEVYVIEFELLNPLK